MKRLAIIVAIVALLAPAAVPQGFILASTAQLAYGGIGANTPGPTAPFRNIGQTCHWLHYQTTIGVTTLNIQIEGSYDNTNWFQISEAGTVPGVPGANFGVIEAGGYFPAVRANITSIVGGRVFAEYFGSAGTCVTGGVIRGTKTSQPVTFTGASNFININLKSTPATVTSTTATVFGGYVENTTATKVYLEVCDTAQSLGACSITQTVCPNNSTNCPAAHDINLPTVGVLFTGPITVACTTSIAAAADPATGCIVNLYYKNGAAYASQILQSGAIQNTQQSSIAP